MAEQPHWESSKASMARCGAGKSVGSWLRHWLPMVIGTIGTHPRRMLFRRRWNEPHPQAEADELADFARFCGSHGVRFGIGLSPFEVFNNFDGSAKTALTQNWQRLISWVSPIWRSCLMT